MKKVCVCVYTYKFKILISNGYRRKIDSWLPGDGAHWDLEKMEQAFFRE